MKFLFYSEFGETVDLATYLSVNGHTVLFHITSKEDKHIGDGIVEKTEDWQRCIGQKYIWVFDSCSYGNLQDWLREQGEAVFGGCEEGDKLENNRQANQKWFEEAGFDQTESHNFTTVDEAIAFVRKNADRRWILKQNGGAPKSINHLGKFDRSEDMLYHLESLKTKWNESEFGKFDCDLMEVAEGLELGVTGFFNGKDWIRNGEGRVIGFLDFEEKKESDGGLGETCGEMGTTFIGTTEDNPLFADILLRDGIASRLKDIGFRGVFNINCIVGLDDKKVVALEPTMRPGVPATSYEMIEGIEGDPAELIAAVARGKGTSIEVVQSVGMVICVVAKPFPLEVDVESDGTSMGERLWILGRGGKPVPEFQLEEHRHIHLYNFQRDHDEETDTIIYKVATKSGYLLTVTAYGDSISQVRKDLVKFIKKHLYLSGMKWRSDIGERVEEHEEELKCL